MTVGGLPKRLIHSRIAIFMAILAGVSAGATIVPLTSSAASAEEEYSYAEVLGGDTYQVLESGLFFFSCETSQCAIKARISLSAAAARYLGLKSPTLATGNAKGPLSKDIEGRRYTDLYSFKLPASLAPKLKPKHVVAMKLSVTGTATYPVAIAGGGEEGTGGEEGVGSTTESYTQHIDDTGERQVQLGQGKRFGCFEVGGLTLGYPKQGGTCPKHP